MANIDNLLNAAMSDRAVLIGRMLDRLDVDLAGAGRLAQGTVIAAAARHCTVCRRTEECWAYLTGTPEDGFETPDRFCPNAAIFASMPRNGPRA